MAASSGDQFASGSGGRGNGDESACSTPFVSAPSSPARDPSFSAAGCFYSAPASPARGGPGAGDEYGSELGFDFDFDFSSRCPSPAAAAMSSADELFHNGQIRPMRLASFLLRPQALPPLNGDVPAGPPAPPPPEEGKAAPADERSRLRSRSVHRRSRSLSPFRTHWLSPSSSPAPAASSGETAAAEVAPSASRSSSSSSTASSASSSSRSYRRWGFFKDLLHRSKSDSGKHPPLPSNPSPPPPAPKRKTSPAAPRGGGRARRSAHARLYEARRMEAEEMRRRTFLPYQQGLLFGCLGLGSRGYGTLHGLAAAAAAAGKSRP